MDHHGKKKRAQTTPYFTGAAPEANLAEASYTSSAWHLTPPLRDRNDLTLRDLRERTLHMARDPARQNEPLAVAVTEIALTGGEHL